ncbi:MAG TPA: hypothetical protein VHH12_15180, partial [Mycobacterium sp.]|nr:hypothetical protein [Mycobacterium sp.]
PLQPNQRTETLDSIGVEIGPGTDEVAFALVADAYSYTGRTRAFAVSTHLAPVRTRHGLTIVPARVTDDPGLADVVTVPAGTPPVQALDSALTAIEHSYGRSAAITAARVMEYPGYSPQTTTPLHNGADAVVSTP